MAKILLLSNRPKHGRKEYEATNNKYIELLKDKRRIAYISSETDHTRQFFDKVRDFYDAVGDFEIHYFDYDESYFEDQTKVLSSYDVLHFSTGNTYTFLESIVKKNELESLRETAMNVEVIIGTSAGGHILCKNIDYARYGDENLVGIEDTQALNIVDFFVVPHYERKLDFEKEIEDFSVLSGNNVIRLNNGQGVFFDSDQGLITQLK